MMFMVPCGEVLVLLLNDRYVEHGLNAKRARAVSVVMRETSFSFLYPLRLRCIESMHGLWRTESTITRGRILAYGISSRTSGFSQASCTDYVSCPLHTPSEGLA